MVQSKVEGWDHWCNVCFTRHYLTSLKLVYDPSICIVKNTKQTQHSCSAHGIKLLHHSIKSEAKSGDSDYKHCMSPPVAMALQRSEGGYTAPAAASSMHFTQWFLDEGKHFKPANPNREEEYQVIHLCASHHSRSHRFLCTQCRVCTMFLITSEK